MGENELTKEILWTNLGGQRGGGRPITKWIDGVQEDPSKLVCRNWQADGQDRGRWRHLIEETKAQPELQIFFFKRGHHDVL